jgi:hypothetical protein
MSIAPVLPLPTTTDILDEFEDIQKIDAKLARARDVQIALWNERERRYTHLFIDIVRYIDGGGYAKDIAAEATTRGMKGWMQSQIGYYELVGRILMKPGVLDPVYIIAPIADLTGGQTYVRPDGTEGISVRAAIRSAVKQHNKTTGKRGGKKVVADLIDRATTKNEAVQNIRSTFSPSKTVPSVDALLRIIAANAENAATHHRFPASSSPAMASNIARTRAALDAIEKRWL